VRECRDLHTFILGLITADVQNFCSEHTTIFDASVMAGVGAPLPLSASRAGRGCVEPVDPTESKSRLIAMRRLIGHFIAPIKPSVST
jgi:hypothetical protein